MTNHREIRLTGWTGVAIAVISLIPVPLTGSLVKPFPYWSDSVEVFTRWVADNQAFGWLQVTTASLSGVLLVVFAAGLREFFSVPGQGTMLPTTITLSATVGAACYTVGTGLWMVLLLTSRPSQPSSELPLRLVVDATSAILLLAFAFFGLEMLCIAILTYQTKALARWMGHFALFVAVLSLVLSVTVPFIDDGPLAPMSWFSISPYMLYMVWIVVASIALLRASNPDRAVSADVPSEGLRVR